MVTLSNNRRLTLNHACSLALNLKVDFHIVAKMKTMEPQYLTVRHELAHVTSGLRVCHSMKLASILGSFTN